MHVRVVDYDPRWPLLYAQEAARIREILGDNLWEIHHIGSTSVANLAAKPVIDILAVVRCLQRVDIAAFEALGYESMGEYGLPGRRFFRKGGQARTHHIHLYARASQGEIRRHLALPAYLRAHPDAALAYGALKRDLAERYCEDIDAYCAGKDAFVKELERRALDWFAARESPV